MTLLGQAQTGSRSSTPKITRINGDDNLKVIYKNMGNNHAYPFVWGDTVTHSGTETVIASGVKWHGIDLATNGNITDTPVSDPGAGRYWIEKNTATKVVIIKSSASMSNVDFDIKCMMGEASAARYIEAIYCRGNTGASQALP